MAAQADHSNSVEGAAFRPAQIELPKGGGAIRGIGEKFSVGAATGTAVFGLPLSVSGGRAGFEPQLELAYDSGRGNGPFGIGWHLSLPNIACKTDKGLPQYREWDDPDIFVLSGAEDLVPALKSSNAGIMLYDERVEDGYSVRRYLPRVEGAFIRIERWRRFSDGDVHWRTVSRENMLVVYGKDENSRITDPHDSVHIFSWLIAESRDDKGNGIVYEYKPEDATGVDLTLVSERNRGATSDPRRAVQRYIKRVRYGNRVPLLDGDGNRPAFLASADISNADWAFDLVFDYGEHDADAPRPTDTGSWLCRNDPFSTYRAAFEVRSYRLCQRILMFHQFPAELDVGSDCLVRSLNLAYRNSRNEPDDAKRGNPVGSLLASATQHGYVRNGTTYRNGAFPPSSFEYSDSAIQEDVRELDSGDLTQLPVGLDGHEYAWMDLDGEGISGVLTEQGAAWYYKRNRGGGHFYPAVPVARRPSGAQLSGHRQQWLDVDGDGQVDLVEFEGPTPGYARRHGENLDPFRPFSHLPNISWHDPNLRIVDLDGDGLADVFITEQSVFTWYPSEGADGFGAARKVSTPDDEEVGPRLLFEDGTQSIFLADMSGDGLTDLVRIRNGETCYWPNIGYGRFGAKVTMNASPWFDRVEQFDARRLRLADVDGTGCADIVYLSAAGATLYYNQAGNGWSAARVLSRFPHIDNIAAVSVVDLLGSGTACLVWSSPLPTDSRSPLRYIDLAGGQKPNLLVRSVNNLGAETNVQYSPSTKFYLADREAGRPWITRLPFVVHVVDRIETCDRVSRNRFVSRYAYHHGYYDGTEREFRGFGLVEQFDTEELGVLSADGAFPAATNIDAASYVPTVCTKTWFHTGVYIGGDRVSRQYAYEYYREGDSANVTGRLGDADFSASLLPDSVLPEDVTADEMREALRALRGSMLRTEIYALDGTGAADRPYSVVERNYTLVRVQGFGSNTNAVFFAHPRESVNFHYDRVLYSIGTTLVSDPRITHSMILAVDQFGNEQRSAEIAYGRRHDDPDPAIKPEDRASQKTLHVTSTERSYTNAIDGDGAYRTPLPAETVTYELIKVAPQGTPGIATARFSFGELESKLSQAGDGAHDLPYQDFDAAGATDNVPYRRAVKRDRLLYRKNDMTGLLTLGKLESLALPFDGYSQAFTPGLLVQCFQRAIGGTTENLLPGAAAVLGGAGPDQGGYVDLDSDGNWWAPQGRVFLSKAANPAAPATTAAAELAEAREHFFLPRNFVDPFGAATTVDYDGYDLLMVSASDPLQNVVAARNDYRVLHPSLVTDPNGNQSQAAFDALGLVVGISVMGKEGENLGDSLSGFSADLTSQQITQFFADPRSNAAAFLGDATKRIVYDVGRYARNVGTPAPVYAATIARETHKSDLASGEASSLQISFSYSDGFGREIQQKVQAETGSLAPGGPTVDPRWTCSGWAILNNKGNPVRAYEPFFDDTHDFRFGVRVGVSATLFYDPIGRIVATLHPNHSWEKVAFDPWRQTKWDVNDTVAIADPGADQDVGICFARLPDADYKPTWYAQRIGGALGAEEQQAAAAAAEHTATPTVNLFDTLGRTVLTISDNGPDTSGNPQKFLARIVLDIEGNQCAVKDALGRTVMRYDHDMRGVLLHQASTEAGERWSLNNVSGKLIRAWDSRGHLFRNAYDALQRPVEFYLTDGASAEVLTERTIYGESVAAPEMLNLRGRVIQIFDQAGLLGNVGYDFKGNLLGSSRQLANDYKNVIDWSLSTVQLAAGAYANATRYDAFNRPIELTAPDSSVIRPSYSVAGLLDGVTVTPSGATADSVFIQNIDYDAKGQRELIAYGNGATTLYSYDADTYRLMRLLTTRDQNTLGAKVMGLLGLHNAKDVLQDLNYFYDPAGNIVRIRDDAQQTIYFRNKRVEPSSVYSYDPLYRLISASGREQLGLNGGNLQAPTAPDAWNSFPLGIAQPGDGNALGLYTEQYVYDAVGNILSLQHRGSDPANPGWTQKYAYNEPSQLEVGKANNRLSSTTRGSTTETYQYAGSAGLHGNITTMSHLPTMVWDHKDQLRATARQVVNTGTPETTWYVYDGQGNRVRKVTESSARQAQIPVRSYERIYVSFYEVYREYAADGGAVTLERETLHVMDNLQRIALVETRTQGDDGSAEQLVRYQLANHLGSASLELDDSAAVISYEEYFPYGSTAYQATDKTVKAAAKRYRFSGKERDEETGFSYHGARYYAPWIGRWTACDPIFRPEFSNCYEYVRSNPIVFYDPNGAEWTRFWGGVRAIGGLAQVAAGAFAFANFETFGATQVIGAIAVAHGLSDYEAGMRQVRTGAEATSIVQQGIQSGLETAHVDEDKAKAVAVAADITLGFVNPTSGVTGGPRLATALAAGGQGGRALAGARIVTPAFISTAAHLGTGTHTMMSAMEDRGGSTSNSASQSSEQRPGPSAKGTPTTPSGAPAGPITTAQIVNRGFPLGFKSRGQFRQFGSALIAGLKRAGFGDIRAAFQGSSVTGRSAETGQLFDIGRVSDFDIGIVSPTLLERAKAAGAFLRHSGASTGPLSAEVIEKLGLTKLRESLVRLAEGREVNFRIFSEDSQARRAEKIWVNNR
ncbi:SpvB/TcaC N-terminal domain-containing protein [Tardiphaga sp.]|uniref:SpvB/TcaC N-terminal domain-containing protein n=1 Tax=Tardiphaga sp. TaxID=1926292 RepID=UPI0026039464|nr:SpvB/TcaC N-terminal domain-containing protein [Tardiphaga sp.]MDB5616721.1 repeat-associated core domain protein [Tardiphaga sp.]